MKKTKRSLSVRLFGLLIGIFSITIVSFTSTVYYSLGNDLTRSIRTHLSDSAQALIEKIDSEFSQYALNLNAWSNMEVMDDLVTGDIDGRIARALNQLKLRYQLPGDIYVFDNNKAIVASSDISRLSPLPSPEDWHVGDDESIFIEKRLDPFKYQTVIAFSHSIKASYSGDKIGVIVLTYPWSDIENLLAAKNNTYLALFNNQDETLYADPFFSGGLNTLKADEFNLNDVTYLVGSSHEKATLRFPIGWRIAALHQKSDAYQPIRTLGLRIGELTLMLSLPIGLLILILTRRWVRPIKKLTQTVVDITASMDLSKPVPIESQDELGLFAENFNIMTSKLQKTLEQLEELNKNLEKKVEQRTQQYKQTNEELSQAMHQLKMAQSQLVQSEKMASLGQLVAGVAHELNNPIGSIYANMPVLEEYVHQTISALDQLQSTDLSEAGHSALTEILENMEFDFIKEDAQALISSVKNASSRVKEIVLSLRHFSRLDEAELKDVLLEEGLNSTLSLLHHKLKSHIEVVKDYKLNQPVSCFAGLINQVFMNLLANAEQAIEGKGIIQVSTWAEGNVAVVEIKDTGPGMSEDVLQKIFDPFFTTKPVGSGTGLGLSISYGVMEKHKGSIQVRSQPGQGSTFTLKLPMHQ